MQVGSQTNHLAPDNPSGARALAPGLWAPKAHGAEPGRPLPRDSQFPASGAFDAGGAGNGPSAFVKETSSNSSEGTTNDATGISTPPAIPMLKIELILGMTC